MRIHRSMWRGAALPTLLMASAGLATSAIAADIDDTTQAGQYSAALSSVPLKGNADAGFPNITVYVPFMLLGPDDVSTEMDDGPIPNPAAPLINATLVENVGGNPVGFVTSFNTDPMVMSADTRRTVTILGTTDADGGGFSNDVVVSEPDNRSDSPGGIIVDDDGMGNLSATIAYMARFSGNQNNIDVFTGITGMLSQTPMPGITGPFRVFSGSAVGCSGSFEIGTAPETNDVLGGVFIGTPSIVRDPSRPDMGVNDDLLIGNTQFNGLPGLFGSQVAASVNAVNVYGGFDNDPQSACDATLDPGGVGCPNPESAGGAHVACWRQVEVPLPTNPPGETAGDARQTQPALTMVTTPGGQEVVYCLHGVGFSGGSPFTGSNFNPMFFIVDTLSVDELEEMPPVLGGYLDGFVAIEADAVGGEGTQHGFLLTDSMPGNIGNLDVTDPNQRFVDHGATGGAAEVSTTSQFDMNANGYVALLHQNRNTQPTTYSVRLYEPIWDDPMAGNVLTGYNLAKIITFSGDMKDGGGELIPFVSDTDAGFMPFSVNPFSGVSLDDNNRVAFCAVTEVALRLDDYDRDEEFLPPELATPQTNALLGQTTSLLIYDMDTDSLHEIIKGGGGDNVLMGDADLTEGTILSPLGGTGEQLMVGTFGFNNTTDSFCRDSFARDGSFVGVSFRSSPNFFLGGEETEFDTLFDFDDNDGPNDGIVHEQYIDRGGLLFQPGQLGMEERNVRGSLVIDLGEFDPGAPICCLGNAAKEGSGQVNFADVTAVLGGWLNVGDGTGVGDANCDGFVNFADVTTVLGFWLNNCP